MDLFNNDDIQWLKSDIGKKINTLEESLQCNICSDYYNNPQTLKYCKHSFCCECIRKHFDQKININTYNQCPQCKHKGDIYCLESNRQLADIVNNYKNCRDEIINSLKANNNNSSDNKSSKKSNDKNKIDIKTGTKIIKPVSVYSFQYSNKNKAKEVLKSVSSYGDPMIQINLDGEKDILEKRYSKFRHLHNAQIGSLAPLTLEQVILKINNDEKASSIEAVNDYKTKSLVDNLKAGKSTKDIDSKFAEMVKKAKASKKKQDIAITNKETNDQNATNNSSIELINDLSSSFTLTEINSITNENQLSSNITSWMNWRLIIDNNNYHFYNIVTNEYQSYPPTELILHPNDANYPLNIKSNNNDVIVLDSDSDDENKNNSTLDKDSKKRFYNTITSAFTSVKSKRLS